MTQFHCLVALISWAPSMEPFQSVYSNDAVPRAGLSWGSNTNSGKRSLGKMLGCFSVKGPKTPNRSRDEELCPNCCNVREQQLSVHMEKEQLAQQQEMLMQRLHAVRTTLATNIEGLRRSQEQFTEQLKQQTKACYSLRKEIDKLANAQACGCKMLRTTPLTATQGSLVELLDSCADEMMSKLDDFIIWLKKMHSFEPDASLEEEVRPSPPSPSQRSLPPPSPPASKRATPQAAAPTNPLNPRNFSGEDVSSTQIISASSSTTFATTPSMSHVTGHKASRRGSALPGKISSPMEALPPGIIVHQGDENWDLDSSCLKSDCSQQTLSVRTASYQSLAQKEPSATIFESSPPASASIRMVASKHPPDFPTTNRNTSNPLTLAMSQASSATLNATLS